MQTYPNISQQVSQTQFWIYLQSVTYVPIGLKISPLIAIYHMNKAITTLLQIRHKNTTDKKNKRQLTLATLWQLYGACDFPPETNL